MPPLPPVAKMLRVDLVQSFGTDTNIRNRLFFLYSGAGPSTSDLTTLATTIANAWSANISPQISGGHTLTGINITDLTSATGAQVITAQNKPGTINTGSALSASTSAIVKFKIARRYRGGHPRFYLSGQVSGNVQSPQQLTSAYQSGLATAFGVFIAAIETSPPTNIGTLVHENVSYFSGFQNKTYPSGRTRPVPVLRGSPLTDLVQSYSVNPRVGNQRRRIQQSP